MIRNFKACWNIDQFSKDVSISVGWVFCSAQLGQCLRQYRWLRRHDNWISFVCKEQEKSILTHIFRRNESTIAKFVNKRFTTVRRREIFLASIVAETLLGICLFIQKYKPDSISVCFHWLVQCNRRAVNRLCMHVISPIKSMHISGTKASSRGEKDLWKSRIHSWRNNWLNWLNKELNL